MGLQELRLLKKSLSNVGGAGSLQGAQWEPQRRVLRIARCPQIGYLDQVPSEKEASEHSRNPHESQQRKRGQPVAPLGSHIVTWRPDLKIGRASCRERV